MCASKFGSSAPMSRNREPPTSCYVYKRGKIVARGSFFDGRKASSTSKKKINRADPMHRSDRHSCATRWHLIAPTIVLRMTARIPGDPHAAVPPFFLRPAAVAEGALPLLCYTAQQNRLRVLPRAVLNSTLSLFTQIMVSIARLPRIHKVRSIDAGPPC